MRSTVLFLGEGAKIWGGGGERVDTHLFVLEFLGWSFGFVIIFAGIHIWLMARV